MFDPKKILLCALLFVQQVSGECDSKCPKYFAILGIAYTATKQQIKDVWLKKVKKLHPDKNPGCADCDARTKELNEAYDALYSSSDCQCDGFESYSKLRHKDGCRYDGASCTCSNTGWDGTCQYHDGISLSCKCEAPKPKNLDGCQGWLNDCTCSDTGWKGTCQSDGVRLYCKCEEPHADGCAQGGDDCTCSDTKWKGTCRYADSSGWSSYRRLHCKCEKPQPQHKDGCFYAGGACRCENAGWSGTCLYQGGNDYLSCKCDAPRSYEEPAESFEQSSQPEPQANSETIEITIDADDETDEVSW